MPLGFMAVLVAITAGGALLRFWDIGRDSLWEDEAASVFYARLPVGALLGRNLDPGNPPGYRVLLKGWIALFGESEAGLRSMSALAGTLAVLALGWLGRSWSNRAAVGLCAAALLAISPYHVYYSREARGYALCVLLAIVSSWLLLAFLRRPRLLSGAVYALLAGLSTYVHYQGFVLLAAQACGAVAWWGCAPRACLHAKHLLMVFGAAGLVAAPGLLAYVAPGLLSPGGYSFWQGPVTWRGLALLLTDWGMDRRAGQELPVALGALHKVLTLVGLTAPALIALMAGRRRLSENSWLIGTLCGGALLFLALTLLKPVWQPKYLSFLQPLYLLGWCGLLLLFPERRAWSRWMAIAVALGLLGAGAFFARRGWSDERDYPWRPDYRAAVQEIQRMDPAGDVPVFVHRAAYLPVAYYLCARNTDRRLWAADFAGMHPSPAEGVVLLSVVGGACPRVMTAVEIEPFIEVVSGHMQSVGAVIVIWSESQSGLESADISRRLEEIGAIKRRASAWRVQIAQIDLQMQ